MSTATVVALSADAAPPVLGRPHARRSPGTQGPASAGAPVLPFKPRSIVRAARAAAPRAMSVPEGEGLAARNSIAPSVAADADLIRAIAAGDKSAMRTLFLRHHARVLRYVMRIVRDHAQAEDVLSEAFLGVWRRAGRFEGRSSVATWICGIARHKALTALEAKPPTCGEDDIILTVADPAPGPDGGLAAQDRIATLRRCIDALSREHREIIDLVYYREKSIKEITDLLGIGMNTVKTRMFYARKRLGALLAAAEAA
jgi:RNA polymerase sigma-70 factor (ECF subfamily)